MQRSEANMPEVWEKQLNKKGFFTHTGGSHNGVPEEENSNGAVVEFCINITLVVFCLYEKCLPERKRQKRVLT